MGNNTERNDELLWKAQWDILMRLLPVTVTMYVLVTVGLIGNILTVVFYVKTSKRTTAVILITSLAVADLATCLMAIPIILEMIISVTYLQGILCKLTHFLGMVAGSCSCLFLWIISIDRYRKICSPLGKQMTVNTIKYIVIGLIAFALLLSARFWVTFDSVEVNVTVPNINETAEGQCCATSTEQSYNVIGLAFYAVDFILILLIWMTVIVTYSKIIYIIIKRRHEMGNTSFNSQKRRQNVDIKSEGRKINGKLTYVLKDDKQSVPKASNEVEETDVGTISFTESSTNDTEVYTIPEIGGNTPERPSSNTCKLPNKLGVDFINVRKPSEVNLTLMMFAVSMIFILCFTPYFVVRIIISIVYDHERAYNFSTGFQFALKLPYLNNILNPFVYCIFNPKFRRYIKLCFVKYCTLKCQRERHYAS